MEFSFRRLSFVYASYIRPQWFIRAQFADLMVSLGFIKTALDVYLEIERWDAVIACYNLLELKHKVIEEHTSVLSREYYTECNDR